MDIPEIIMNNLGSFVEKENIDMKNINITKANGFNFHASGDDHGVEKINKFLRENSDHVSVLKLIAKEKSGTITKFNKSVGKSNIIRDFKRAEKKMKEILELFDCRMMISGIDKNDYCTHENPALKMIHDTTVCSICNKPIRK